MKTITFFISMLICTLFSFSSLNAQYSKANMAKKNTKTQVQVNKASEVFLNWSTDYVKNLPSSKTTTRATRTTRSGRNTQSRLPTYKAQVASVAQQQRIGQNKSNSCAVACIYQGADPYKCTNFCDCVYVHGNNPFDCIQKFVQKAKAN